MRGAVAHGQYVIVAGDVAAAGKVIGVLGETGSHSIGPLQDTHRWFNFIDIPGGAAKEGGGASEGHLAVRGGLHLHVAALCVFAGEPWRVSNGRVRVLAIQRAGAVGA